MKIGLSKPSTSNLDQNPGFWLNVLTIWHALLALGCLGMAIVFWRFYPPKTIWMQWLIIAILLITAILSALAARLIQIGRAHV